MADRGGGGGGGGSWRLPPDETLQVQDPKEKDEVSRVLEAVLRPTSIWWNYVLFGLYTHIGPGIWRDSQLEEHRSITVGHQFGHRRHRNCNLSFRVSNIYIYKTTLYRKHVF